MRAFAYFDGVPTEILYDNTKLVVASFLGDGERRKTRAFSGLQSHSLFAGRFGRPGRRSDKGYVENLVGYARRNFRAPIPAAVSWEAVNDQFVATAFCATRDACALTRRPSGIALSATALCCCHCRRLASRPAPRPRFASARSLWFATAPTTTRRRPSSARRCLNSRIMSPGLGFLMTRRLPRPETK